MFCLQTFDLLEITVIQSFEFIGELCKKKEPGLLQWTTGSQGDKKFRNLSLRFLFNALDLSS